jgi:hypothetical protein
MSKPIAKSAAGSSFAGGAMVLVLALYLPYFILPVHIVTGAESVPSPGWDIFLASIIFPPLWPSLAGHVALWVGLACLVQRRWQAAAALGVVAFAFSLVPRLFFDGSYLIGFYAKLSSMVALTGVVGAMRFSKS